MKTELEQIIEVLEKNNLTANYEADLFGAWEYKGIERKLNPQKISNTLQVKVLNDMRIAKDVVQIRMNSKTPREGDFFFSGEKYYMLVRGGVNKGSFQLTEGHYLHLSYTGSSYSGSFSFDYANGVVYENELVLTEEVREGNFWIFSNEDYQAHNGVDFSGEFKVWTIKEFQIKKYIFITNEGLTTSPNLNDAENLQVLGFAQGRTPEIALENLLAENSWIKEYGYDVEEISHFELN